MLIYINIRGLCPSRIRLEDIPSIIFTLSFLDGTAHDLELVDRFLVGRPLQ